MNLIIGITFSLKLGCQFPELLDCLIPISLFLFLFSFSFHLNPESGVAYFLISKADKNLHTACIIGKF